jgi:CubicO group peptidase (beta-lactamase class C family)
MDWGKGIKKLIERGVEEGVYPGAVLLVAEGGKVIFCEAVGNGSLAPEKIPMKKDTIFDLASLTKPLATTLVLMKLVEKGRIQLDRKIGHLLPDASLGSKRDLTPRLLLSHSAGLADWKPFYERLIEYPMRDRKKMVRQWIIDEPFAYEPGKGNIYSDLGFMLLEWIIEENTTENLAQVVQKHFYGPLGLKRTMFVSVPECPLQQPGRQQGSTPSPRPSPSRERGTADRCEPSFAAGQEGDIPGGVLKASAIGYAREEFAATEECPWRKRVLQGEVHDDNAWALGGCSGHAGLFGTAEEIHTIVNVLREHFIGKRSDCFKAETVKEFFRRQNIVEGSDWALGWDTRAIEGSSAGMFFSRDSVGHTGFTGTSIWMDLKKDVIAIFLSNRIHPKRDNDKIKQFRPVIHDAIMEELGLTSA